MYSTALASAFTLWAVRGELVILLFFLFDLNAGHGAFMLLVFASFRLLIGVSLALTTWYCWRTNGATIFWATPAAPKALVTWQRQELVRQMGSIGRRQAVRWSIMEVTRGSSRERNHVYGKQ